MNPFKIDHTKKESTEYISFFSFFKGVLIFLIVCSLGFILLNAYHVMMRKQENIIAVSTDKGNNSSILTGIHITHHYKEQKVFSIQAKTASIKNKKIGFFRIGGLKQLELKNMMFDYYEPFSDIKKQLLQKSKSSDKQEPFDLLSCFSKTERSLPVFKDSNISGFAAKHAVIRYHHSDGSITIISSSYMDINNRKKAFVFYDNTSVHYKKKFLLCKKRLYLNLKNYDLISNNRFTFIDNGKMTKGRGIKTNLRLDKI